MNDDPRFRRKPPHNVNVLQRWLTETSQHTGIAAGRLRRWLGFMIVAAMLDKSRHSSDSQPLFLIKGGVAMELRFDTQARATKDLDTAFREDMAAVAEYLDAALRSGHGDFTATRTELEPVKDTGTLRCDIKLAYRSRSVSTIQLEIAGAEGGMGAEIDHLTAKPLDHLGLTGPATVPCVAVRWQIAQKLHACTEPPDEGENDRFRDLIDLQLLGELIDDDQWISLKAACVDIFTSRATHPWPPQITIYDSWGSGYSTLAEETRFGVANITDAITVVRQLIDSIHGSDTPDV